MDNFAGSAAVLPSVVGMTATTPPAPATTAPRTVRRPGVPPRVVALSAGTWPALSVALGVLLLVPGADRPGAVQVAAELLAGLVLLGQVLAWGLLTAWLTERMQQRRAAGRLVRHGPLVVALGWFVPVAQLVLPYGVVEEATWPLGSDRDPLLRRWWAGWVLGWLLTLGGLVAGYRAGTAHAQAPWMIAAGVAFALSLAPLARVILGAVAADPVTP